MYIIVWYLSDHITVTLGCIYESLSRKLPGREEREEDITGIAAPKRIKHLSRRKISGASDHRIVIGLRQENLNQYFADLPEV